MKILLKEKKISTEIQKVPSHQFTSLILLQAAFHSQAQACAMTVNNAICIRNRNTALYAQHILCTLEPA